MHAFCPVLFYNGHKTLFTARKRPKNNPYMQTRTLPFFPPRRPRSRSHGGGRSAPGPCHPPPCAQPGCPCLTWGRRPLLLALPRPAAPAAAVPSGSRRRGRGGCPRAAPAAIRQLACRKRREQGPALPQLPSGRIRPALLRAALARARA